MKNKLIVFITSHALGQIPSQRFRFEQYLSIVERNGFKVKVFPFFNQHDTKVVRNQSAALITAFVIMRAILKRLVDLAKISRADFVFIHREAIPVGPPVYEWLIAKLLRKKIIYDFDDAIWLTDNLHESAIQKILRCRWKVASICRWSYKVSCGNAYLASFARQYNSNIVINPTTIDTENLHNPNLFPKQASSEFFRIAWTGSSSTLKYLEDLGQLLEGVEKNYPKIEFIAIADRPPKLPVNNVKFVPWSLETEISSLVNADIGLMPLPDDQWAKGKCGFKALQYMALEIPTIASPVGVNTAIIEHGKNGLLATGDGEWFQSILRLIHDSELRKTIGREGRKTVVNQYSVASNTKNFLSLFQ
ncbi:MAG TPA: glycosyltransferase family 4 protein [Chryseosolibacter sp.]